MSLAEQMAVVVAEIGDDMGDKAEKDLSNTEFTPSWSGAITRTVTDKLRDLPHIYDLVAAADRAGTSDWTNVLTEALATGERFVLPKATLNCAGNITCTTDNAGLIGQGRGSVIRCTHLTNDVFVLGDGAAEISGLRFEDFRVWATVTKSAGHVFNARYITDSEFADVRMGSLDDYVAAGNAHKLYDGIYFNRFNDVTVRGGAVVVANEGLKARGNADQSFGAELDIDGNVRFSFNDVAMHVGGACGGVYLSRCSVSEARIGVLIDQALGGVFNREVLFSGMCVIDACSSVGVKIDQSDAAGLQVLMDHPWIASNTSHGIHIVNGNGVRVVANAHCLSNGGDGLRVDDANCYVELSPSAIFDLNAGYGVNPTVATSRVTGWDRPRYLANTSGEINRTFNAHMYAADDPLVFVGSLSGGGAATIAHGVTTAHSKALSVSAFYKGGSGEAVLMTGVSVDGANINLSGGGASAHYRVELRRLITADGNW